MDIPCAVIYAGAHKQQVMLALQARAGRSPVTLLGCADQIRWRCADGQEEALRLTGTFAEADYLRLVAEINAERLLVGEYGAFDRVGDTPESVWLLGPTTTDSDRQHVRERH